MSILRRAGEAHPDRKAVYGEPLLNHERIARLWTARLFEKLLPGVKITPTEVTSMMRLVKEARLIESPGHEDSLVDIAGYAALEEQFKREPRRFHLWARRPKRPRDGRARTRTEALDATQAEEQAGDT